MSVLVLKWWPRPESDRRHMDFQSIALPTELPGHLDKKMADQTGIEPAISSVTGRHVNRYTTGPFSIHDCLVLIYYYLRKVKMQAFIKKLSKKCELFTNFPF